MPSAPKLADTSGTAAIIHNGTLPTDTIPLCLNADLVDEYEHLQEELVGAAERAASEDSLSAGGQAAAIRQRLAELQEQIRAGVVEFKLRALGRKKFKELKRKHPPRGEDSGIDERQQQRDRVFGANEDTFFAALLRVSLDEAFDDDTWQLLVDEKLTEGQFEHLSNVALTLNRSVVNLPFSLSASPKTTNSDVE